MVCATLRSAGYEVVEAVDGQDGLRKAGLQPMSLVLADHDLQGMDGLTLVRRLRALPEYRTAPMLILTAESSDQMKVRSRAAGATGWLLKPVDPTRLLALVHRVLG